MDPAPPPYSETDPSEYSSNAGTTANAPAPANSSHSSSARTPSSLHTDGATSRPPPSTNSSVDEVVFTPPYSPALSNHAFTDHDHLVSSSAAAYFDSRPATIRNTGPPKTYTITVTSETQPQDLPFPENFRAHGVLDQDWLTFLNYLLSDFIFNVSRDVGDRKDNGVQREGTEKLDVTIAEWNEGFFKPRGLQISTIDADEEVAVGQVAEITETSRELAPRVPGAWIPHDHIPYDHEILGGSSAGRKRGFFGGFKGFQGGSQHGFRMGPIVADNDGFRIGGKSFMKRETTDPERGRASANLRLHRKPNRSSSVSSTSTSTSESSMESGSSIGSLPEYDDLKEQQLPIAKQSLLTWLNHPEQPMTKSAVYQLRHEIQSCRNIPPHHADQDVDQLRREVRELMKEFRESKKRQKRDQRQARRERRAAKRAQKTERRAAKREARKLKRECRSSKGKEPSRRPPWMTSKSNVDLEHPPPMPPRPAPDLAHPFTRAASVPVLHHLQSGVPSSSRDPIPGITNAMHSTWPYSRDVPYSPGNQFQRRRIPGSFPNTFADSSELLYSQAKELEMSARSKEEMAIELRTEATGRGFGEKDRLKKFDQAAALEEEAEKCILEADRLRAEALHLDGELAREIEETGRRGHPAGFIQG